VKAADRIAALEQQVRQLQQDVAILRATQHMPVIVPVVVPAPAYPSPAWPQPWPPMIVTCESAGLM
jgi:hypothetical protein